MFKQRCLLLFAVILLSTLVTQAQYADSLFKKAQKYAADENYSAAQAITKQLISLSPQNRDYQLLSGKIYSWQGKTDSAKMVLEALIALDKSNAEAYDALTNAHLWNKEYDAVIAQCRQALTFVPQTNRGTFDFKIVKAYYLSENYSAAKQTLDSLLTLYPKNKMTKVLMDDITKALFKNYVSLSYLHVAFYNPESSAWNFGSLEYHHKQKKIPFLVRFNYGNAYSKTAYQLDVDAYPRINKNMYLYLNAGYSSSKNIFPEFNAGADIYYKLPHAFEASIGARRLQFASTEVYIYTAYLGKYYKKNWLAYRPFLVNKGSTMYLSHTAIIRTYFSTSDNYISLNFIYGATPYTTVTLQDISRVNSQRIGIDFQKKLFTRFIIRPMISYEYEEYFPHLFRDRFYGQLTLLNYF